MVLFKDYNSKYNGDTTMFEHVFINLNPFCLQCYKFHVHRGKGSGDTVTQIYSFAPKSWNMVDIMGSQLHT